MEKIAPPGSTEEHKDEDNDPEELIKTWASANSRVEEDKWKEMVKVRNVYFEWVPAKEVDCYVCETGFVTREDIGRFC